MPEVRLLTDYVCDVEWWVAYPADPRWTHHEAGEVYWATDAEAEHLLREGIAEPLCTTTRP